MSHGLVNNVCRSHSTPDTNVCNQFIPQVVAHPVIRKKCVLHIMDGIKGVYQGGPAASRPEWTWENNALLFATDPVLIAARRERTPLRTTAREKAVLVELENDAGTRLIAVNFGDAVAFAHARVEGLATMLHTGEPRFGGNAVAPGLADGKIVVPAHSAAFFGLRETKA